MKKADVETLLQFPCKYQFKAMGLAGEQFKQDIAAAVSKHAVVIEGAVSSRLSGMGTYQSVSVQVTILNYEQLTCIYADLRQTDNLKMLL